MTAPQVTVVIVNYNGRGYLSECLAALQQQTLDHRVLVVDNASSDGSARAAHAAFPRVGFLPLRHNVGFCRAVNIAALRLADSASIMVTLNPDTHPEPDFLEALVDPMSLDNRIGAVAGTLVFDKSPNRIASAGIQVHRNGVAIDARIGTPRVSTREPQPTFGASGGAAAYRLAAFCEVRGYCEPFFMYLEDVDLAWRLRLRAWETLWSPAAVATHMYSASAGEGSAFKRKLLARNRLWTLARCLPGPIWARDWRTILAYDVGAAGYGLLRRDWAALGGRAEGVARLAPRLIERTQIQRAASIEWETLDQWLDPPLSGARVRELRRLTSVLARESAAHPGLETLRKVN